jgi:hypothetical protein
MAEFISVDIRMTTWRLFCAQRPRYERLNYNGRGTTADRRLQGIDEGEERLGDVRALGDSAERETAVQAKVMRAKMGRDAGARGTEIAKGPRERLKCPPDPRSATTLLTKRGERTMSPILAVFAPLQLGSAHRAEINRDWAAIRTPASSCGPARRRTYARRRPCGVMAIWV